MTLLGTAATAGMLTIGAVSSDTTSACIHPFGRQIIGWNLCCSEYEFLNQLIDAQRA